MKNSIRYPSAILYMLQAIYIKHLYKALEFCILFYILRIQICNKIILIQKFYGLKSVFLEELVFLKFVYFWLRWVFVAVCGLPLVAARGGYSSLRCAGFSLRWLHLQQSTGSRQAGFTSCSVRAQQLWLEGCREQAQQLRCTGLVAPQHVGSSQTRARTRVPCISRQILNHCATREVLEELFINPSREHSTSKEDNPLYSSSALTIKTIIIIILAMLHGLQNP